MVLSRTVTGTERRRSCSFLQGRDNPMTTPGCYIGIDVAKATLAVDTATQSLGEVTNTPAGFKKLLTRLAPLSVACVVMEATGIYGQAVATALMQAGYSVAVVQPGCVRHFARSQNILAKTDAIDARLIARYGEVHKPRVLQKPSVSCVRLRALIDRREQIIHARVSEQNHREACQDADIRKELTATIQRLRKQERRYDKKIGALMAADQQLTKKRQCLESEMGVGTQTASVLLAHLPELGTVNRQQIAALVGLAPYNRDSGTMRGKRAIAGGRRRLRKALFLAAMTAVRWNEWLKEVYVKLLKRGKCKMVAIIACARKLIIRLNALMAECGNKAAETTMTTA